MKVCFKCGIEQPVAEFYAHPMMRDGRLNKCKRCAIRDVDERYKRILSTPEGVESERHRGREKYKRLYYKGQNWTSPPATESVKKRARTAFAKALKSGLIVRPVECEDCGYDGAKLHGHHTDYTKPLDVIWVCPTCHRRRHALHPDRVKQSAGRRSRRVA